MKVDLRYRAETDDGRHVQGERLQEILDLLRNFVEEVVGELEDDKYDPRIKVINRAKSSDFLSIEDLEVMQQFIQDIIDAARNAYEGKDGNFADGVRANADLAVRTANEYFEGVHHLSDGVFPLLKVQ